MRAQLCGVRLVTTAARRSNASTAARSAPSHARRCLATTPPLPQLVYFAFRGRALACRVALFNSLGKDGWIDERVSLPRFKKAPKPARDPERVNAEYVTNNLPQLNLPCGSRVTQSHAIARFAAKLRPAGGAALPEHHVGNLYPEDARDALLVDEAIAVVDQILLLTPKDADARTRLRNREAFADSGFLRVGMELFEGRLARSGGPFLLGGRLSIADLYVRAPLCDLFDLNQFEGVDPATFMDDFPRVRACGEAVLKHPLLESYHQNYKN